MFRLNDCDQIEPPIKNRGGVFLGNYKSATDEKYLQKQDIKFILSVVPGFMFNKKLHQKLDIKQKLIQAEDRQTFNLAPHFDEAADFIYESLKSGNVLVHCAAGISRSTACLIAYYIKYRNMTMESAWNLIKEQRPWAQPNMGFQEQLKEFEKIIQSKK